MKGKSSSNMPEGTDTGYALLPVGEYLAQITDYEDRETKSNHDPMVFITLEVLMGDYKGKKLFDNIIFPADNSPAIKIRGKTCHFLHCIGEPHEGDFEWNSEVWIGRQVRATVVHQSYYDKEGKPKTSAKIEQYILDDSLNTAAYIKATGSKPDAFAGSHWEEEETP